MGDERLAKGTLTTDAGANHYSRACLSPGFAGKPVWLAAQGLSPANNLHLSLRRCCTDSLHLTELPEIWCSHGCRLSCPVRGLVLPKTMMPCGDEEGDAAALLEGSQI